MSYRGSFTRSLVTAARSTAFRPSPRLSSHPRFRPSSFPSSRPNSRLFSFSNPRTLGLGELGRTQSLMSSHTGAMLTTSHTASNVRAFCELSHEMVREQYYWKFGIARLVLDDLGTCSIGFCHDKIFTFHIYQIPVESRIEFCHFCKIWSGQDDSDEVNNTEGEKSKKEENEYALGASADYGDESINPKATMAGY
ncbi:hypothetical protein CASFOL_042330 [Castilleja foliolosa]|uniref:Uncharacterized protein n=1 Tax=Castilleja foliolosa TaxID=1961234 RepID=A0ABD3BA47_9LAMI